MEKRFSLAEYLQEFGESNKKALRVDAKS